MNVRGMTVYAVLRKDDYSLVNIHSTLDKAIAQVLRLESEHCPHSLISVKLSAEGDFDSAYGLQHLIQPYLT